MPIAREGRFLLTHDLAPVPCLGLESAQLAACVAEIRARSLKGVFGAPSFGFEERSLDVLRELPGLEAVWFWDVELRNVEALEHLPQLRFFGVHPKRPAIDFSRLPALRHVVWHHKASDVGIELGTQLEVLHVWHYKPAAKSCSSLRLPASLTELQLNWANVTSLDGLPALPRLERLEVHRCRNLASLGQLSTRFPRLRHLVVTACGRVPSGEAERVARELPGLQHVHVD